MTIRKKKSKSLDAIGKRRYGFDFQLEKTIYCYLSCLYIKKKKIKKLDNALKFNSYKQWKEYIQNKYASYSNETLIDFSKYLNQGIRNVNSGGEYMNLCMPVIMTLVITKWMETFLSIDTDLSGVPFIVTLFTVALLIAVLMFFLWKLIFPKLETSTEKYMLEDYKEIIDDMIEK